MFAKKLLDDVLALPLDDRIEVFERLRENLRNDLELFPLSEEHKRILDERLRDMEENPDDGSPWDEVETRLAKMLAEREASRKLR